MSASASLAAAPFRARPAFGVACVLAAALVASVIGLLVRMVETASPSQVVFWRCASMAVAMALVLVVRYRAATPARIVAVGWPGAIAAVGMAGAMTLAIWAFTHTTIANVLFIAGAAPFVASLLAWALLGERLPRIGWIAIGVSFAGIAVMTLGGLATGRYLGDLLALVTMLSYAGFVVAMRAGRAVDMMPVLVLGAAIAAVAAAVAAPSIAISASDLLVCVALGAGVSVAAYVLLAVGSRHVGAGELALLGTVEIVFGPLWVWLAIDELPSAAALLGGAVILGAVVIQGVAAARRERV